MKLLFVCSGNAHRSPLAEALLKKMRSDLEVDSAGTNVAIPIAEKVKEYLEKQNAQQYLKKTPESLYSKQISEYDLIVAMEQRHKDYILSRCPRCNVVLWKIEDPYFLDDENAEKVYKQIEEKIRDLAKSL